MNLNPLFKPKTLAVIGVSSTNDQHPANVIYNKNFHRYPVEVFAVNPRGGSIHGETSFESVSDIDKIIDLAVIAVRAQYVPDIIQDCIKAGVGSAILISGGFAEIGQLELQEHIVAIAKEADFPFLGPNCLGIYVPMLVDTLFLPIERMVKPEPGKVAFISQSGGILVDHMIKFASEGVGLSKAISIGNKALIRELDLLNYLAKDNETQVLAFYIEGFYKNEGREFVLEAEKCSKPVIVMKSGKSPAGSKAVSSHTASLAGDYESFSAVMAQHGIVEAENEFELVSFCESLSAYRKSINGNIGIITGSGGHGAMAVDACFVHGLDVPNISEKIRKSIISELSPNVSLIASVRNPIDLTGSAVDEDFIAVASVLSQMPEIDCIIVLLLPYLPGVSSDLGSKLSSIYKKFNKPLIAYVPHVEKYSMLIEGFELNGIPVSPFIEGSVLMAKALRRNKPW